jgi:hypothetical protein
MKQPEEGPEESIWSAFSFWLFTESWRINPATFFRKEGIIYDKINYQYNDISFIALTPITQPVTHLINNVLKKMRWHNHNTPLSSKITFYPLQETDSALPTHSHYQPHSDIEGQPHCSTILGAKK